MGVLYARVAGAWVPISGGSSGTDEVSIGTSDPIATNSAVELWYDTDDEPVAADNANYWNSSWGIVATGGTSTQTTAGASGTMTDTGVTITWQTVAGRRYRINAICFRVINTAPYMDVSWTDASNAFYDYVVSSSQIQGQHQVDGWTWYDATTSGPMTLKLRAAGTTNAPIFQYGGISSWVVVEDIGPLTRAAVNPPAGQPTVATAGNALGIVAMGSMLAASTSLPLNTRTQVTNNLSFTMLVGRRYRVTVAMRAVQGAANCFISLSLRDGTTLLTGAAEPNTYAPVTLADTLYYEWVLDGDGVARSFNVALTANSTTAVAYTEAATSFFYIEDVGPNQSPALPIPETAPGWTPLTLQNAWTLWSAGRPPNSCRKLGDVVSVRINVMNGTNGTTITTLPPGFRPPYTLDIMGRDSNGAAIVNFNPDGIVVWYGTGSGFVSLYTSFSVTP